MYIVTTTSTTVPVSTTQPGASVVTLNPPSASHGIPGDATDPADFYGLFLALLGIALAVVLVRLIFRNR